VPPSGDRCRRVRWSGLSLCSPCSAPHGVRGANALLPPVVAPAEVFLEPDVRADEEIAAAHLLDFELGYTVLAVAPGDRGDGEGVPADNRLQGEFDREI